MRKQFNTVESKNILAEFRKFTHSMGATEISLQATDVRSNGTQKAVTTFSETLSGPDSPYHPSWCMHEG